MRHLLVPLGLFLLCAPGFAGVPAVGIYGTAHDLSASGLHRVTQATQVCVFCHAIHSSPASAPPLIPVWNHVTTALTFRMFNSANVPGVSLAGAVDTQPTGPSLACLSCHDGSVAVGALVNTTGAEGANLYATAQGDVSPSTGQIIRGPALMGADLTNNHPISITYQDDRNPRLVPAADLVGVKLYPANATGGKVQCSSCHDVHNYGLAGSTAPFLRVTMVGSALCRSCHLV